MLHELELFRLQSHRVQELLTPTLRPSSWNAHSESVLITMLCSSIIDEGVHCEAHPEAAGRAGGG